MRDEASQVVSSGKDPGKPSRCLTPRGNTFTLDLGGTIKVNTALA